MRFIPRHQVQSVIHGLHRAQVFSVRFVKSDGTLRVMTCRKGVTAHLKGGKVCYDASNNIGVFDMNKKAYRSIPMDRVLAIKQGRKEVTA